MQAITPKSIAETRHQTTEEGLTGTSPHATTSSQIDMLPAQDTMPIYLSSIGRSDSGALVNFDLSPLDSFPFPERTTISQEQSDFCIKQFKGFIPRLVQQNQSPFIHPNSYQQMPPAVYQDLLGVSAMYCQKSPQNQSIIFSTLDSRISSLIESSKSSSWLAKDYLVSVQALVMYQIIRLFDGDIRQRANAERHLELLQIWTFRLHSRCNIFRNDSDTESPYQRWVFIESTRRTITMSIMVQAMYSLVRDGYCTSVPLLATLPVSVDGALWKLPEESWWQTTLGLGGDLFTYQDFVNHWNGGQDLYTDTYESILLGACRHNIRRPPLMLI
jgi:hypothetical protein